MCMYVCVCVNISVTYSVRVASKSKMSRNNAESPDVADLQREQRMFELGLIIKEGELLGLAHECRC